MFPRRFNTNCVLRCAKIYKYVVNYIIRYRSKSLSRYTQQLFHSIRKFNVIYILYVFFCRFVVIYFGRVILKFGMLCSLFGSIQNTMREEN